MTRHYTVIVPIDDEAFAAYGTDDEVAAYLKARLELLPAPEGGETAVGAVHVLDPASTAYVAACVQIDAGEHAPADVPFVGTLAWYGGFAHVL